MNRDELYRLLDEMSLPDSIVDALEVPNWRIFRRREHIKESERFHLLKEYIESRTEKKDLRIRENVYVVMSKLLDIRMDPEHCRFLIERLKVETNKEVLHTMLSGISRLQLPKEIDVSSIVECSKSDEWMVRHTAIMALGKSDTDASREAVRYWVNQKDEKQYNLNCYMQLRHLDTLVNPATLHCWSSISIPGLGM